MERGAFAARDGGVAGIAGAAAGGRRRRVGGVRDVHVGFDGCAEGGGGAAPVQVNRLVGQQRLMRTRYRATGWRLRRVLRSTRARWRCKGRIAQRRGGGCFDRDAVLEPVRFARELAEHSVTVRVG